MVAIVLAVLVVVLALVVCPLLYREGAARRLDDLYK